MKPKKCCMCCEAHIVDFKYDSYCRKYESDRLTECDEYVNSEPISVTGKWIYDGDCLITSCCHKAYDINKFARTNKGEIHVPVICPNCGASMENIDVLFLIYKSDILGNRFPNYKESIETKIYKIEHPMTRRIGCRDDGPEHYIQYVDNDMIRITFDNDGRKDISHFSIKNFYIQKGDEFTNATRSQVLFALNNICYVRAVFDDMYFVSAAIFGISKRSALTTKGYLDITDMK